MSLNPGTRLGTYEILGAIGAGGMGEVYRARDHRLQRDVALKILPDPFANDPDRLVRFEREATTLASLNHPSIAQVYGIEESSGTPALVMELVSGQTLQEVLAARTTGLDTSEVLPIARQIADALEAAHGLSIVHRDLKPANVKIRPDGTVKVLDFGLAKALGTEPANTPAMASSPTVMSPAVTEIGVVLGTPAYMAPEQARGRAVDHRADVWSFGCVLYEMLTGVAPFRGSDTSVTIAAILTSEADYTRLPPDVPESLRRLLRRCLEKDVRKRLSAIADARLELDEALAAPVVTAATTPAVPARRSSLALAAAILSALAVGAAAMWLISTRAPSQDGRPVHDFTLRRLTELPGAESSPDISPDGRQVVFTSHASGQSDVYVLRVGGARAINLTEGSAVDDGQAAFSPDGERIAFRSDREGGGIFIMGGAGESVRRVTTAGFDPSWSPDGKWLAYATEGVFDPSNRTSLSELWTAEVATGRATRVSAGDAVQPAWSPDGTHIAYCANTNGQRDLWVIPASGGTPVAVTKDAATDWSPEWSPDGRWLYFSSDRGGAMNVWRVPVAADGTPAGEPETVTRSLTGVAYARLAADSSRMTVMAYTRSYELSMADFDAAGAGRIGAATTVRTSWLGWCAPSPAGDWVACTGRGAQEDIFLMKSDGSETVRLMDDAPKDRNPTWSSDGSRITFKSTRAGQWDLWSIRRDGSELQRMSDLNQSAVADAVWSSDGKRIIMSSIQVGVPRGSNGLWLFDPASAATKTTAQYVTVTSAPFAAEAWSRDTKLVAGAIVSLDGRPAAIGIWDLATQSLRRLDVPVSRKQDYRVVAGWLPDSRRLLAAASDGPAIVDVSTGAWRKITPPLHGTRYLLSADAQKLMIERELFDGDVWLMEKVIK